MIKFSQILMNIQNVLMHIDDILIYGEKKHDKTLMLVLERLSQEGITINKEKSEFGVSEITHLDNVILEESILIAPKRAEDILKLPRNRF